MNVLFKNKGSGRECRRTIDLHNHCIVGKQLIKQTSNKKDGTTHRANEKGDNQQTNKSK